ATTRRIASHVPSRRLERARSRAPVRGGSRGRVSLLLDSHPWNRRSARRGCGRASSEPASLAGSMGEGVVANRSGERGSVRRRERLSRSSFALMAALLPWASFLPGLRAQEDGALEPAKELEKLERLLGDWKGSGIARMSAGGPDLP